MSEMRPLGASDAAAVLRLQVEVEAADHDGENYDLDDVIDELADPDLDLEADTVGIFDDELLLAQLRLHSHEGVLVITGAVDPAVRRRGHGTVLLGWARTQAVARSCRTLSAKTNDGVPGAPALFAHHGLVPVRRWYSMQRPVVPDEPVAVPAVAGIVTAPVDRASSEQLRLLHLAAFSEHWGSEPPTPQRWAHWFLGSPHHRRETSLLAREGGADGEIVGYALGYEWPADTVATGVREAWLGQLGVPVEHRRRGIGALLLAGFVQRAAAAGYGRVGLGVDTENASNALALYEGAGFTATVTFTTYEGPVG